MREWLTNRNVDRAQIILGLTSCLSFALFLLPLPAFAQQAPSTGGGMLSTLFGGVDSFLGGIGYAIWTFANFLLWLVATFFNFVVEQTVFNFAKYIGGSDGVIAAWKVIRDVSNIGLLFGFIFIGITTILDVHGYEAKKTLPRLIIFAVLLNFSLLATQLIIDTSNVLGKVLYDQVEQCPAGTPAGECAKNYGISGAIMGTSGGNDVFSAPSTKMTLSYYLGLSVFSLVLTMVLLAGAILLISRAIILVFLMALSPIGFAGLAIPPLNSYAKQWWQTLIGQSFFAPVYLLLIFIGLKISETLSKSGNLGSALQNGSAGAIDSVLVFTITSGFMIGALMIAKSMSQQGAGTIISSVQKGTASVVFGTAGFVGRRTAGRAGAALSERVKSSEWAQKRPLLGKMALGATKYAANSSFDGRGSTSLKAIGAPDFGKVPKGAAHGYHGIEEAAVKSREAYFKELEPSDAQNANAKRIEKELDAMVADQDKTIQPKLAAVADQAEKLSAARKSGDAAAMKSAENAYNSAVNDYNEVVKGQKKAREGLEKTLKVAKATATKAVTTNYINALHEGAPRGLKTLYKLTAGPHADHVAAAKIKKNSKLSKTELALKHIGDKMKDEDKDDHANDNHDDAGHAPTAPAAGGGGGGDAHGAGGH